MAWSGTSESGERPPGSDPGAGVAPGPRGGVRRRPGARWPGAVPVQRIGLRIGGAGARNLGLPLRSGCCGDRSPGPSTCASTPGCAAPADSTLPPEVDSGVEIGGRTSRGRRPPPSRALRSRKLATPGLEPVREEDRAVARSSAGVAAIYREVQPGGDRLARGPPGRPPGGSSERADVSSWQPRTAARFPRGRVAGWMLPELPRARGGSAACLLHPSRGPRRDRSAPFCWLRLPQTQGRPRGSVDHVQARRSRPAGVPAIRVERHHCGDAAGLDKLKDINPYAGSADLDLGRRLAEGARGEGGGGDRGGCCGGAGVAMAPPTSAMTSRVVLNNVAWRAGRRTTTSSTADWDVDAVLEQLRPWPMWRSTPAGAPGPRTECVAACRTRCGLRWAGATSERPEVVMEYASRSAGPVLLRSEDSLLFRQERGEEPGPAHPSGAAVRVAQLPALDHSLQACASRRTALQIVDAALGLSAFPRRRWRRAPCKKSTAPRTPPRRRVVASAAAALLLTGCGGGDTRTPPPPLVVFDAQAVEQVGFQDPRRSPRRTTGSRSPLRGVSPRVR
ncbi:hypothetical protein QJS66_11430 [Kocuria rhizophila]|nr:hypothetical protein QJS66_11430 [Kocuria rhizophila]